MIENQVIRFGLGSLALISSRFSNVIHIKHIKPPAGVGVRYTVEDMEQFEVISECRFVYRTDMKEVLEKLPRLAEYGYKLPFRGYVLDFTEYQEASKDALMRAIQNAMADPFRLLVC